MQSILFLCTGNSCRSQMAEGWARHLKSDKFRVFSAGTKSHGLNPYAVRVMQEAGVDISGQQSKTTDMLTIEKMDFVITVCSNAAENCPYFPGGKILHRGFDDPPALAADETSEENIMSIYRRVRDEIKSFVENIEDFL